MFNQVIIVDWIIISLISLFFNSIKELHHNDMSNIKSESDISILSMKYDLEEQLKTQKVGRYALVSLKSLHFSIIYYYSIFNGISFGIFSVHKCVVI